MLAIACLSYYDVLRFSSPCLLTSVGFWKIFFYNGFKILTTLRISLLFSSKPSVFLVYRRRKVAALNKMSSNATTLQTFCQADSLVTFIRSRNPDHILRNLGLHKVTLLKHLRQMKTLLTALCDWSV